VKRKLQDQFLQRWNDEVSNHNLYMNYRSFKKEPAMESYLTTQPYIIRRSICKFRCSNHRLEIEKGRHIQVARDERYCKLCTGNYLGDEYHHLLECQNVDLVSYRRKYIPRYYHNYPSMFKYVQLMQKSSHNISFCNKIGLYLKNTMLIT